MGIDNRHVHFSDWASQPEVRIACTQEYGRPWTQDETLPQGVYEMDETLYTFNVDQVTCLECLKTQAWQDRHTRLRRFEMQLRLWGITEDEYVAITKADPFDPRLQERAPDEDLDTLWKGAGRGGR